MVSGAEFCLPENPSYTIEQSMADSLRFTVERTLMPCKSGLCSRSSFVDADGTPMLWHDFGPLEGPGWASNAVGGAYEVYRYGRYAHNGRYCTIALAILDHVLQDGFIDETTGFIRGYRHTGTGKFFLNYRHNDDWFCPGSMAKVACQLLMFSKQRPRVARIAAHTAAWLCARVKPTASGWFPRRVTPDGTHYPYAADGRKRDDAQFDRSADGLSIVHLMTTLTERKLADYRLAIAERVRVFMARGGIFGSINQDVYDDHEDVAYAVAFHVLRQAARLLQDDRVRRFAYEQCLAGLDRFKMVDDRHGVATKGLLFMAKSWDTAYLWESAEASLAYMEAFHDTRRTAYLSDGVTILRAIARHHHGRYGFLTEGVDWNNHVGAQHHFDGVRYGDIKYTEPFLNNQHITEPTLYYLEEIARRAGWRKSCEERV
jgi:hypothetical protein